MEAFLKALNLSHDNAIIVQDNACIAASLRVDFTKKRRKTRREKRAVDRWATCTSATKLQTSSSRPKMRPCMLPSTAVPPARPIFERQSSTGSASPLKKPVRRTSVEIQDIKQISIAPLMDPKGDDSDDDEETTLFLLEKALRESGMTDSNHLTEKRVDRLVPPRRRVSVTNERKTLAATSA